MAAPVHVLEFPPFRLDLGAGRLWRDDETVDLRPKTWQLLRHMAERPGQLLPREEVLDAVWGDVAVTGASLNQAVLELRRALGDDAREPRFIETVHRRGFRFVAQVRPVGPDQTPEEPPPPPLIEPPRSLHGRSEALGRLDARLEEAKAARRQVVFVTGDAGMGKTSLLRAFADRHAEEETEGRLHLAWGQCTSRRSGGESYFPVLDAIDRLSQRQEPERLLEILKRFAPSWLIRLPWLLEPGEADGLRRQLGAVTAPRMVRELCVATEAVSRDRPLVLLLEDLHWTDPATVDLLGALAERTEPARLLVLATYRPVDAALGEHPIAPLRRRLQGERVASELALAPLSAGDVDGYLRERFGWSEAPSGLAEVIQGQTDGNPLFIVTLTGHLVSRGLVRRDESGWRLSASPEALEAVAPESLKGLVEDLLMGLDPGEREALEAASVAGETFDSRVLAAALESEQESIEETCGRLARGARFIEGRGTERWPGGVVGQRFAFKHTAFRRVLSERLGPARRQRLHRRIGELLDTAWASEPDAHAAEVAFHLERGNVPEHALEHLARAATVALRNFAPRDAAGYLRRALDALGRTPQGAGRDRRELDLSFDLARCLAAGGVWGSPELDRALHRCLELSESLGDVRTRAFTLDRMVRRHTILSEYEAAGARLEELRRVMPGIESPALRVDVAFNTGLLGLRAGELKRAEEAFAEALAVEVDPADLFASLIFNPTAIAWGARGYCSWLRGFPDDAWAHTRRGVAEAERAPGSPVGVAVQGIRVELGRLTGSPDEVRTGLERHREVSRSVGHAAPSAVVIAGEGWLLIEEGETDAAVAHLRKGLERVARALAMWTSSLHVVLAEARLAQGDVDAGLRGIEEALEYCTATGERAWEAEIHRLKGELCQLEDEEEAAEADFFRALELARTQGAGSLELRAATSLARLWQGQGDASRANRVLKPVFDRLEQGRATRDLVHAAQVLDAL